MALHPVTNTVIDLVNSIDLNRIGSSLRIEQRTDELHECLANAIDFFKFETATFNAFTPATLETINNALINAHAVPYQHDPASVMENGFRLVSVIQYFVSIQCGG